MDAFTELTPPGGAFRWRHFNLAAKGARAALEAQGLDSVVFAALTAGETRPRCTIHEAGVLLNLRGINVNPGAEPEDMVSLRLWLTSDMVVSVQLRQLPVVRDVMDGFAQAVWASGPAALVSRLALRLADGAEPVVAKLNEAIDGLEEGPPETARAANRAALADLRRQAIVLRRYMFPQRDALSALEIEDIDWIDPKERARLREATERVTRLAEELDAIRDRAQLVQELIMDARSERMNRQMLVLSVAAALFLPLGLLTGLLGVNVAGIPGAETPWAFWAVCGFLVLICAFQLWLFWWFRLIGRRGELP